MISERFNIIVTTHYDCDYLPSLISTTNCSDTKTNSTFLHTKL